MAYNPYNAVKKISELKGSYHTAKEKGQDPTQYAQEAVQYYNELRKNGKGDVADKLAGVDYTGSLEILKGYNAPTEYDWYDNLVGQKVEEASKPVRSETVDQIMAVYNKNNDLLSGQVSKVTLDEFNTLSAKYLENLERFKDDLAAGKVTMPEETPVQDNTPTGEADTPTAEGNTPTETASEPVQENAEITTAQPEILNEKTNVEKTVAIPEQPVMKSAETSETQQESVQTPPEPAKTTSTDNNPMVSKAVEAARVDADSAAFDLVAEAGSVKKAIDALYEEGVRLGKMGTPEAKAIQSEITSLWDAVAAGNTRKLQIRANTIPEGFPAPGCTDPC
ncbi:MAG: hypothetical protein IJB52_03695 [Clostridia bacterium]|nr:hypothetical protein [Clostridia bacterium]